MAQTCTITASRSVGCFAHHWCQLGWAMLLHVQNTAVVAAVGMHVHHQSVHPGFMKLKGHIAAAAAAVLWSSITKSKWDSKKRGRNAAGKNILRGTCKGDNSKGGMHKTKGEQNRSIACHMACDGMCTKGNVQRGFLQTEGRAAPQ